MEMLKNEIQILKDLDHPNIVKMFEFLEDEKRIYIVTEICKGGELFDEILNRSKFDERDAAIVMKQLLSAVNYCHKNNIVHRDLKPENILLEQDRDLEKIKVVDFGTSLVYDMDRNLDEKLGTAYYIAPEVIKKSYTEKCDLWSSGVILYILLSGEPPFNDPRADNEAIMKKVEIGKYDMDHGVWKSISREAKDLVKKLLTYDPSERISAEDALQHPWIIDNSNCDVNSKSAENALNNLHSFRADQKLKQAAFAFIASQLVSKKEKDEIGKCFKSMDKNGDGKLSKEEILEGYDANFGKQLDEDEVDNLFRSVDIDGSGFIDYSEFIMATMNQKKNISEEKLQAAFKTFDKDGNGTISANEIREVLGIQNLDDDTVNSIISQADENQDGEIQFDEFCHLMKNLSLE